MHDLPGTYRVAQNNQRRYLLGPTIEFDLYKANWRFFAKQTTWCVPHTWTTEPSIYIFVNIRSRAISSRNNISLAFSCDPRYPTQVAGIITKLTSHQFIFILALNRALSPMWLYWAHLKTIRHNYLGLSLFQNRRWPVKRTL